MSDKLIPYWPSNSDAGMAFDARWCANCNRDAAHREDEDKDGCAILAAAMAAFDVRDPLYPREWIVDTTNETGGRCTAYDDSPPLSRADRLYLE